MFLCRAPFALERFRGRANAPGACVNLHAEIIRLCLNFLEMLFIQTHSTDEEMFSAASFSGLVEFSPSLSARPQISHVVFDFDGTVAWLKHGWPDIMANLLVPYFLNQTDETLRTVRAEILALNGKP